MFLNVTQIIVVKQDIIVINVGGDDLITKFQITVSYVFNQDTFNM